MRRRIARRSWDLTGRGQGVRAQVMPEQKQDPKPQPQTRPQTRPSYNQASLGSGRGNQNETSSWQTPTGPETGPVAKSATQTSSLRGKDADDTRPYSAEDSQATISIRLGLKSVSCRVGLNCTVSPVAVPRSWLAASKRSMHKLDPKRSLDPVFNTRLGRRILNHHWRGDVKGIFTDPCGYDLPVYIAIKI